MNELIIFNEENFLESWRFNSPDCHMTTQDKQRLVFFDKAQAKGLWREYISKSYTQFMLFPKEAFQILDTQVLDFNEIEDGKSFFRQACPNVDVVIFFWGASCACIAPMEIVTNFWTDFFYPSDEDSIIFIPNSRKKIFSFEERFFVSIFN
jgi:hypothetical protein